MDDYSINIETKDYVVSLERAMGAKRGEIVGKILLAARSGKSIQNADDLSAVLGVTRATIYNWLQDYKNFLDGEQLKGGESKQ
jgi:transposase